MLPQLNHRFRARKFLFVQGCILLASIGLAMPFGILVARDVLCGGMAAILGNLALIRWVFKRYRASYPGALIKQFFIGESVRFAVIVVIFLAVIQGFDDVNMVALLAAFFIVQVVPAILANKFIN